MSDQDFFFDEDEKPTKSADKAAPAKKSSGSASRKPASTPPSTPDAPQSISMTIAVLIGVIALLLGVVIGLFVGKSMAVPTVAGVGTGTTTAPAVQAPQLSPEQMQSGELPEGHPTIGSGAASGTAAPAK